jgi:hypothetical protein
MTSREAPKTTYLEFKTPHYIFQMKLVHTTDVFNQYSFEVGDEKEPCLDGTITLQNMTSNSRHNQFENKAILYKLDALEKCSIEDITSEYLNKYSFGKEMLDAVIFFINSQFPDIQTIRLNDTSFIPCNRKTEDTLDLLSYSIALYQKTWYEKQVDAYILPREKHTAYRKQVEHYASKQTKQEMSFDLFSKQHLTRKHFPRQIVNESINDVKDIYESSETFPEFFQKLSRVIPRDAKCRFFKDWLYDFIASYVSIDRTWYFDLYPKIRVLEPNNRITKQTKTRKRR